MVVVLLEVNRCWAWWDDAEVEEMVVMVLFEKEEMVACSQLRLCLRQKNGYWWCDYNRKVRTGILQILMLTSPNLVVDLINGQ